MTAILAGRGLRAIGADRRYTTPEAVVDVDIALPGREPPDAGWLVGVISPDRKPTKPMYKKNNVLGVMIINEMLGGCAL